MLRFSSFHDHPFCDVVSSRMHVTKAIATRVDGGQGQDDHATGSVLVFRLGKNGVVLNATSALVTSINFTSASVFAVK